MFELCVDCCVVLVLLDDGVVDWLIVVMVLDYCGFVLVGDIDGGYLVVFDVGLGEGFD